MRALGASLARMVRRRKPLSGHARVIALVGELGSGKTTFVQGFMRALGVEERVTSPTFLIVRRYPLRTGNYRETFHIDLYRIRHRGELNTFKFDSLMRNPRALVIVEWADKVKGYMPKDALRITFFHGKGTHERIVVF